ncbi:hypothetical protein B0T19DRAFT_398763 [Cercophora scortea]|uniref:Uncharacterized protein n=1 Tax=Cercophora scortea TaxID=314031 RepID=A0AAE0IXG6_9PEZI|nr:hypothetical protein B0T19DRAFT_398763 [Cercophora scortea]
MAKGRLLITVVFVSFRRAERATETMATTTVSAIVTVAIRKNKFDETFRSSCCWRSALYYYLVAREAWTILSRLDVKIEIFSKGLGSLSQASTISRTFTNNTSTTQKLTLIVLANAPQPAITLLYLLYSSLFTNMLAEQEWHRFGLQAQPLRVPQPRGQQQGSFFLVLPWQYALPLLVVSAALHWTATLSLFFVEIDVWDADGSGVTNDSGAGTVGFSCLGIFVVLIIVSVSWVAAVVLGLSREFPAGMLLLGVCSAVVAAACHLPDGHGDCDGVTVGEMVLGPLSWGVVRQDDGVGGTEQWLGFSSGEVEGPAGGKVYG